MSSSSYSKAQLEGLWEQAGGSPADANTAAAVALAESSGNPSATNINTNGTTDRGLWQINSIHGTQSTYDPLANARAAVSISSGGSNWSPWVTFNSGAYRQYLGAGAASSSTPLSATGSSSSSGSALPGGLVGVGVKAILYLALIAGGLVLLWYGTATGLKPAKPPAAS